MAGRSPSQIKLAVFMHGNSNYHIAGWRHPEAYANSAENLARWAEFAQTMNAARWTCCSSPTASAFTASASLIC